MGQNGIHMMHDDSTKVTSDYPYCGMLYMGLDGIPWYVWDSMVHVMWFTYNIWHYEWEKGVVYSYMLDSQIDCSVNCPIKMFF